MFLYLYGIQIFTDKIFYMSDSKQLDLSITINDNQGNPIQVTSISINGQSFLPESKGDLNQPGESVVIAAISDEKVQNNAPKPPKYDPNLVLKPGDDFNTLEEFGGNSFHKMFWGTLTYSPVGPAKSKITFEGEDSVFDTSYVGMWVEPSRIHQCSQDYPEIGRNYFPGALSTIYSRVVEVIDGKNLLVDFEYNGGNFSSPTGSKNQDGIFFFDNKFAIESWSQSSKRKNKLKAKPGQIYASLGMPSIIIGENSNLEFSQVGEGESPAIHLMWSDAFNGDKNGKGISVPKSFVETFGENGVLFSLPGKGKVDINFEWQFLPPTYSHKVVQYGSPTGLFFHDGAPLSSQYGLKRVVNKDQFRIKKAMKEALGFLRGGIYFGMPNQGYCNGGGVHDGEEIISFCTYRFEGDWFSKEPNNMKARTSGGLRVEWIGESSEKPGNFIEMESQKAYRFDKLKLRFLDKNTVEVDDPVFTWFNLACQEWTGGTSTGSEAAHLEIEGFRIGLNSNGDHWLVNGDEDLSGVSLSAKKVRVFDKIPSKGDLISQNLADLKTNGLIGKVSNEIFEIWGWSIQKGDVLTFQGRQYNVVSIERKWKTWAQFGAQYNSPPSRLANNHRKITYTQITLDSGISQSLKEIEFLVYSSQLEKLLDNQYRKQSSAVWNFGNEAPGHLMYTDYNVNLIMKNVQIHGMIRSTSRPLWAKLSQEISGNINSIPVSHFGEAIWKKGDRLFLFDPNSKASQIVEVNSDFSGSAGNVLIVPVSLSATFSKESILTAKYSLCSESRFDHVNFVNEDLTPCYSERIDYRPQGLRLRQLLEKNVERRIKINGGRISWYSNLQNEFEPQVEFSGKTHLVNPRSVVAVLLNPVVSDGKGLLIGYQFKEKGKGEEYYPMRVVVRNGEIVDLSNSEIWSDLTLEGNGEIVLDNLKSKHFVENGKDSGIGFNLVVQERFFKVEDLKITGKNGKVGVIVNSPLPIGVLKIDLRNWELAAGLFNAGGFQSKQNQSDSNYSNFVKISN